MASVETLVQTELNSPVAYWPLVAKYDSGLSNVGADYGPNRFHAIADGNLSAISGPFDGERVITGDGSSAYISVPNIIADELYAQSTAIWVMGWHKHATGAGANRVLFYMPNSSNDLGLEVGINTSNQIYGSIRSYPADSVVTGTSSPDTIANDTWEFFCVRFRVSIDQIIITLGSGSHRTNSVSMASASSDFGSGGATTAQTSLLRRYDTSSPPDSLYSNGGLAHLIVCKADTSNTIVTAFAAADAGLNTGTVAANNSAAISLTMYDRSGALVTNKTGLEWAWFDSPTPSNFDAPADSGSDGEIDGSGVLSITADTSLDTGSRDGFLIVSDTDGDPDAQSLAFAGPVTVTVT